MQGKIEIENKEHQVQFEKFLSDNAVAVKKNDRGEYSFLNKMIYDEWVQSPQRGKAKIEKMRNTKYFLQGNKLCK
ncbi:TPA: hypothetical protein ACGIK9_003336 [Acinetobacter baumannii]|uniref:hypothetical protein n=1 Tax=Acinetobacter baumannii TaxID=470 RepID=UPI00338ECBED